MTAPIPVHSVVDARQGSARRSGWHWVPSLYFSEGLPYVVVMALSVVMYKRLGVSNKDLALYTSWLYLPWVIKPFWSPLVEVFSTKRRWIVVMQLLMGSGFAGVAFFLHVPQFFQCTLAALWLLAFSSATHDIAADGFYLVGLSTHDQAWFVGIRSTAYRLAMIAGQGVLLIFAGFVEGWHGLPTTVIECHAGADAARADSPASLPDWDPGSVVWEVAGGGNVAPNRLQVCGPPQILLAPQRPAEVSELRMKIRRWNEQQGFYKIEIDGRQEGRSQPAWQSRWEAWIRSSFGEPLRERSRGERVGNVAIVYWRLAEPLQENQTLTILVGRHGGSRDLQLLEGERFQLNDENSDKIFGSLIQADPRLHQSATASFAAKSGNFRFAWTLTFYLLAAMMLLLGLYHGTVLPSPERAKLAARSLSQTCGDISDGVVSFFQKPRIVAVVLFLLLYRFAESQLVKLASPFLLDARDADGLGLSTAYVGIIYGTVGVLMLTGGGILGGFSAARYGLKTCLWWMVVAINLPNLAYIYLAYAQPTSTVAIGLAVAVEQFGYGLGFTAYMLYMIYISQGRHETVHYAFCTGLMALGMMIPGMFSGWLQELIGYRHFFVWVMLATIPSFLVTAMIPLESNFGRKEAA